MGKKSKTAKSGNAATAKTFAIDSMESLLDRILSEYIQVNTVPSGAAKTPFPKSKNDTTLHIRPLCHWERGCPQNLSQFLGDFMVDDNDDVPSIAYAWWGRSRLRFSCSTLAVFFVKVCVPKLKAMGIDDFPVQVNDGERVTIQLEDLELKSLGF
ncbi:MAG: hypothetical protein SGARI_007358, partial [Bacillariaceae sp.]